MAKPTTRQELKDYALRQLGYPVLEINVADEQVDDALDDSLQLFQERHFDGVERVLLKYKITENDIKRGRARGAGNTLGITTSSTGSGGSTTISGDTLWDDVILRQTFDGNFTDYALGATAVINDATDVKTVASPVKVGTGALSLAGTFDYMNFPYNSKYNFQGEWTFESWVYIDTSPAGGAIWSMSNGAYSGNIFGMLVDNQGSQINFRWQNTEGTGNFSGTFGQALGSYPIGSIVQNWVHVALTRRASDGSIHLFINGEESTSTSSNQIIDNNIPDNPNMSLYIGAREKYADSRYLDGLFDDIRITTKERYTANFTPSTTELPIDGTLTTSAGGEVQNFEENTNFLNLPDAIIGVEKLYLFDSSFIANNMFSFKYQLFLNDVAFNLGYSGLLSYAMTKTYIEDIDFLLSTNKQIRYNKRNNRLYLDVDWGAISAGTYIIIDCQRIMDPANYAGVYNDSFLKRYFTSKVKRQWGQNLIKFQGVKLPGGIELNGRQIYEDAVQELQLIEDKMLSTYEIPPLDLIG
jgi:hypothetical protein